MGVQLCCTAAGLQPHHRTGAPRTCSFYTGKTSATRYIASMIPTLIGHQQQQAHVLRLLHQNRLPHALLLCGTRGIGKHLFATHLTASLLTHTPATEEMPGLFGDALPPAPPATTFHIDWQAQQPHLLLEGAHPDVLTISRPVDDKGKVKADIPVDSIRALEGFLGLKPAMGNAKVVIIDAADDLNPAAANALLKNLEEPTPNTTLLLIAHAPNRLLPTIRSRCQRLLFAPLSPQEIQAVLALHATSTPVPAEITDLLSSPGAIFAWQQKPEQWQFLQNCLTAWQHPTSPAACLHLTQNLEKVGHESLASFTRQLLGLFEQVVMHTIKKQAGAQQPIAALDAFLLRLRQYAADVTTLHLDARQVFLHSMLEWQELRKA